MATDRLINKDQGDSMISALGTIATNVGNITYGPQTSADKVVSMTGYAKASTEAAISQGDTLNEAVGKLEKKVDDNATAIEGKTAGPESATVGDIATFNNVNGKVLNDSGISIQTSVDTTKDTEVPTSKAVDTYVTGKGYAVGIANSTANHIATFNGTDGKALKDGGATIAFNTTGVLDDDTAIPTSKAVQSYVTSKHYAGSSSDGGAATSADKLNIGSSNIGSATQPVYFDKTTGQPVAITNTIQSDVPANAVFTDTTYTVAEGTANGKIKVTPSSGTAYEVPVHGLGNAAYKGVATSVSTSEDLVTSKAVNTKLASYVPNSDFVVAENNIKYAINTGAKNQLKLTGDVYNPNTLFAYWDYTNGTVRVVGSSATSATVFIYLGSWTAPEDNVYRLYANGLACTANIRIYDDASWTTYAATSSESNEATWTKGTTRPLYLRIASGVVVGDITVTPMICQKSVFDADSSFVPYGALNSDLSALEAEDRAGLIECVDAGAKNLIDVNNYSNLDNVTISNGVFTTQGDTLTTLRFDVYLRNGTTQLLKVVNAQVISSNGMYYWEFVAPTNANNVLIGHNGSKYNGRATINFTNLVAGQRYVIQVNVTQCQNASGAFKWQDVMICTKAAFAISPKFVPYAKSNYSLMREIKATVDTYLVDKLGKNLLTIQPRYYSATGASIAVNADKTVTISVTGTVSSDLTYILDDQVSLPRSVLLNKRLVLSGKTKGTSDLIRLQFLNYASYEWSFVFDDGDGARFTFTNSSSSLQYNVAIVVKAGAPTGTYVIKPMLCYEALFDMDKTFVIPDYTIRAVNILRNEARLNGVINTGIYSPSEPTIVSTMYDLPTSRPENCTFVLKVSQIDSYRILQEITFADLNATSSQLSSYRRYKTASGSWTNWQS